jgi:zinc-ribbon domain
MTFCSNCGQQLTVGTEKFCPNCGQDLKKGEAVTANDNSGDSVNIHDTKGDVFGVGVRGSGNIIGKNIVVGSGTINVSQQELSKIPIHEYANALKEFSESVTQYLKGKQIPEDKVNEINVGINELAKEVQDINPGEEKQVSPAKRRTLNGKFGNVVRGVLKVLPAAATIASSLFSPLAPFSSLIGESVQKVVDDYV